MSIARRATIWTAIADVTDRIALALCVAPDDGRPDQQKWLIPQHTGSAPRESSADQVFVNSIFPPGSR